MNPNVPLDYELLKVKQSEENWPLFPLSNIPTYLSVYLNIPYFLVEWVDCHWFIKANPSIRALLVHLIYSLFSYGILVWKWFSIIRNFEAIASFLFVSSTAEKSKSSLLFL